MTTGSVLQFFPSQGDTGLVYPTLLVSKHYSTVGFLGRKTFFLNCYD